MLYFLTKWLFIITCKSLTRQFKTGLSERRNQTYLKRAHDLDEFLVKYLEEVRASAEVHVWNANKDAGEEDNNYLHMLGHCSTGSFHCRLHYEGAVLEIPFKPSSIEGDMFESGDEGLIIPADVKEAQRKIDELSRSDEYYEDTEPE